MTLRNPKGARRYNDRITLTWRDAVPDDFGHADIGDPVPVLTVYAQVRQMSATKTAMTFQIADIVGVDIEFRTPIKAKYNGCTWRGHDIHFPHPEDVDDRGRITRLTGWYQIDNPKY